MHVSINAARECQKILGVEHLLRLLRLNIGRKACDLSILDRDVETIHRRLVGAYYSLAMRASARTMPPGKITSAKPIDSSSAADSTGVLPPSTIFAISGTPPSAGGMRLSSARVLGASTNSMSAPASR